MDIESAKTERRRRPAFDPDRHARPLIAIVEALRSLDHAPSEREFVKILRRHPRDGNGFFSRSEILAGFRRFAAERAWGDEGRLAVALRKKPVRTLSGIAPLTVFTKPFPCPGRCVFCPSDVRMPKSYLSDEPGCQRAAQHRFDPYAQTCSRLRAFAELGHPTDKIEMIVLGGTWSHYPEAYQRWFVMRCFEALNDFAGPGTPAAPECATAMDFLDLDVAPHAARGNYNAAVSRHLRERLGGLVGRDEHVTWAELEAAHARNTDARARCVGLCLETRPDAVDVAEVVRLRRLGATKIQIGLQSLDDRVLASNGRGHTVAEAARAFRLLRGAGFKLLAHWMPNLLGSSAAADRADYSRLFADEAFRPDELKIYPCVLLETADLVAHHATGAWQPYPEGELAELVGDCIARTPRYVRLSRIVRDIPATSIVAGSRVSNLRELVEGRLERRGRKRRDLRAREIRGRVVERDTLRLRTTRYKTSIGRERLLEWTTRDDLVAAFLRLSLPGIAPPVAELAGAAVIREVHVYGESTPIGERRKSRAQHIGLGRALIERAAKLAREAGYERLAVISAVGTRRYYEGLGFETGSLYQHRSV